MCIKVGLVDKCVCRVVWWISVCRVVWWIRVYEGWFGGYVCIKVGLVDKCVLRLVWWISVYVGWFGG